VPKTVGSQHSATVPEFTFPNIGCAASCLGSNNYSTCYNQCVNPPASNPSSAIPAGSYGVTTVQGNQSPVVTPGTNKNTTSGPATTGTGTGTNTANQTYPSSAASSPTSLLANVNWQDVGIRAGLVIAGMILIIVGVIKLFSGQPVQVPGTLARRRPKPTPPPSMQTRSFVETRQVGSPPANATVRTTPNTAAAAAGAP
jgi:hypothetical protein